MEDERPKHKRRERYKGAYPKSFKEKYKEQQPDLYASDVEKVIAKGRTPAGMHLSVCVSEIMDFLKVTPGQVGLDATLGYGGHSLEILKCLFPDVSEQGLNLTAQPKGKLYAMDVDPYELPKTQKRLIALGYDDDMFIPKQMNFSDMDLVSSETGPLNFIIADLGLSSMQIDNPERGFSLKLDGPLDLRLNPTSGKSAASLLKTISKDRLEEILVENADEPFYELLANAIIASRDGGICIETTIQLKKIVTDALVSLQIKLPADDIKKSCQRCFQALRVEVNNEFGALEQFLEKLPEALAPGGRVAILSFHSGEDRRVKKSFRHLFRNGIYKEVALDPIRASPEECFTNRRARSAKFRWAIKA